MIDLDNYEPGEISTPIAPEFDEDPEFDVRPLVWDWAIDNGAVVCEGPPRRIEVGIWQVIYKYPALRSRHWTNPAPGLLTASQAP
jgi:hypothetical protein